MARPPRIPAAQLGLVFVSAFVAAVVGGSNGRTSLGQTSLGQTSSGPDGVPADLASGDRPGPAGPCSPSARRSPRGRTKP